MITLATGRSWRKLAAIAATCAAGALDGGSARADLVVTSWLGGTGSWTAAANWSGGVVPNNTSASTFDVRIDGGNPASSEVTMQGAPPITIDALTIDPGDVLDMRRYQAEMTVNGSLTVNGTLRPRALALGSNGLVAGAGTIEFLGYMPGALTEPASHIRSAGGALTIGPGITITGGLGDPHYAPYLESVGATTAPLINRGRILASNLLVIAGSTIDNRGILETKPGGILGIDADFSFASIGSLDYRSGSLMSFGVLDNTGQNLRIDDAHGGFYLGSAGPPFRAGTIRGGTITTGDGRSLVVSAGGVGRLDGAFLNGSARVLGRLEVPAGQAFRGDAEIAITVFTLEDEGIVAAQSGTTVVEQGIRIRGGAFQSSSGHGSVGNPGEELINRGTIQADRADWRIRLPGNVVTNAGTLRVDAGALLVADGTVEFASGGRFVVGGGGSLSIAGLLDLTQTGDVLEVLPLPDGSAYTGQVIIAPPGWGIWGWFDHITPGISVQHAAAGIRIFGTPVPDPVAAAPVAVALGGLLLGRGARRSSRRLTPDDRQPSSNATRAAAVSLLPRVA